MTPLEARSLKDLAEFYGFLHLVAGPMFVKYAPEPGPGKSAYSFIYHLVEYVSLGNGKSGGKETPSA